MSLITNDWRLKLLAVGLAILMLGAVAFSQNPPTQKTLTNVSIGYTLGPGIIVLNAPSRTNVTVTGLADALTTVNSGNISASFDLSKASPGPNVHANLTVQSRINDVKVENPIVPYVLNIDQLKTISLPVQVRVQRTTTGWFVTKKEARCPGTQTSCTLTFTGPATWESNLVAYADFTPSVQQNSQDLLTVDVLLVQNGQPLDLTRRTEPLTTLDPSTVDIHIEAKTGTTSRQVVLIDAQPVHGPAAGYRITNVTVDPVTVVLSGAPDALARITTITLNQVDLSGATSDKTFQVTIPLPPDITSSTAVARVTYSIAANPNASAGP